MNFSSFFLWCDEIIIRLDVINGESSIYFVWWRNNEFVVNICSRLHNSNYYFSMWPSCIPTQCRHVCKRIMSYDKVRYFLSFMIIIIIIII